MAKIQRLQAIAVDLDDEAQIGYIPPTRIASWVAFLRRIAPYADPKRRMAERLCRNIGHRLQLLEFFAALLLLDYEVKRQSRGATSTLHETVSRMMMHQYSALATHVLEAVGTHLHRVNAGESNDPVSSTDDDWISAIVEQRVGGDRFNYARADLKEELIAMCRIRDQMTLLQVGDRESLDFESLTYEACFIPSYTTFADTLGALSPKWPKQTVLNERRKVDIGGNWRLRTEWEKQ